MKTLNRFALIVRPASPYIAWAAKVAGESEAEVRKTLEHMEAGIYLLPPSDAPDANHPNLLKAHWRAIFEEELGGWCTDEGTWPKDLSEALFRAWFKLELVTTIHDFP